MLPLRSLVLTSSYAAALALWLATGLVLTGAAPVEPPIHATSRLQDATWKRRNATINAEARAGRADVVFLGDSITQGWTFSPEWRQRFGRYHPLNAGIASDRVEHLLWRVRHGNLGALQPKAAVLLIGVNDLVLSSPDRIAAGVRQVIAAVHQRSPKTIVLLHAVFPSGKDKTHPRRAKIAALNERLAVLATLPRVEYVDIGDVFLEKDGSISKDTMFDYLHLTARGYALWADALDERLAHIAQ